MRNILAVLMAIGLCVGMTISAEAEPSPSLPKVIDQFMALQFPKAQSYFWIVNEAHQQGEREVLIDLNAIVYNKSPQPEESRFLLLIVDGEIVGAQGLALDAKPTCKPETVQAA